MPRWAVTFLIFALIGAVAGFSAASGASAYAGQAVFLLGLVLFVVSMVGKGAKSRPPL